MLSSVLLAGVQQPVTRRQAVLSAPTRRGSRVSKRRQTWGQVATRSLDIVEATDEEIVQSLNKEFGKQGVVFAQGKGGLPVCRLTHECGSSAEVYLFGAVVTSFKQPWGSEVLYVRPDAKFDRSKPISGGIPHCFPQFGPGELQQHGFARNMDWEVARTSAEPNQDLPGVREPEVALKLIQNEYTLSMWPHNFELIYVITLQGGALKTTLEVVNTNTTDDDFSFTSALHTYIGVDGVKKSSVRKLSGLTYLDKVEDPSNPKTVTDEEETVKFDGELMDRVYLNAPDYVELDVGTGAAVTVTTDSWKDCVVWNPGQTMPECFDEFVCVEQAVANKPIHLSPQQFWMGTAIFKTADIEKLE